ncbi:hypothetical protein VZ94_02030 [Methylocucumis oryzae]|uniref:Uncharacterized protein n=1 Tax=Methylocucumis oryzae TaxID=1632867 RepID=A0A0F3IME4_9GAMM|nr:hypothetical protein VZ94_02030 [Methylocucumis oryzae]
MELEKTVAELQGKLGLNSSNSSLPPSKDGFNKSKSNKNTSIRDTSTKKSGGQEGHPGTTLSPVANPDKVIPHHPPGHCDCGLSLAGAQVKVETRQVFDIPPVKPVITEHQVFETVCQCGKVHRGQFPAEVKASVQYGPVAKATAVSLTCQEMLPINRTGQLMGTMFCLPMSDAAVLNAQNEAQWLLSPIVDAIAKALKTAPVLHADETGMNVGGKNKWVHIAATAMLTWMGAHNKRGKEAFDALGILGQATGILIHDGLSSYRLFDEAVHGLCNQHHLRELNFVATQMNQEWAGHMMTLLRTACHEVNASAANVLPVERLAYFRLVYEVLLLDGEAVNPKAEKEAGKRGKAKQGKAYNLLLRLRGYADDVWRFAYDPNVPFTNNIAEQAVRMNKVKQKVSGCFRSMEGLEKFCVIRSYLATLHKQGVNIFAALIQTFAGSAPMPQFL